jgi:hypothetical protein
MFDKSGNVCGTHIFAQNSLLQVSAMPHNNKRAAESQQQHNSTRHKLKISSEQNANGCGKAHGINTRHVRFFLKIMASHEA